MAILDVRLAWLTPLLLATVCLSLAPGDGPPSCGVFPAEQISDCSVAPTLLRLTRAVTEPLVSSYRPTRAAKHKRRVKTHRRSRVARSAQEEEVVVAEEEGPPQLNSNQRHPYSKYEDKLALQVQGDWKNVLRQIQATAFVAPQGVPRYCPHCRQLLPPDSPLLHHPTPTDPRMFLPIHTPRYQAVPLNSPSLVLDPNEYFSNLHANKPQQSFPSEESCPFNNKMTEEQPGVHSPSYVNQTTRSPNIVKEFTKAPVGFPDVIPSSAPSSTSPLSKGEMTSMSKRSKLPTVEELTKYLEKNKNNS